MDAIVTARIPTPHKSRKLTDQQKNDLLLSLESTTFPVPDEYWDNKSYKQLIEEGKRSDYEALS